MLMLSLLPILFQILLDDENFNEALNLLDQAISEGIQLDVLLFNTILRKACEKVLNFTIITFLSLANLHVYIFYSYLPLLDESHFVVVG